MTRGLESRIMAPAEHPIAPRWSIAVVIALYNGERFIDETLRAVFAQSLSPDEIVVVDDGSSDRGTEIVEKLAEKHPITLIKGEHCGQSAARNLGIDSTTSDLIAVLDHDDAWYPRHLEKLRQPFLESHRDRPLGWVYSDVDEMWADGKIVNHQLLQHFSATHPKRSLAECLAGDMYVLPSASLVSREAFYSVGGFDEQLVGYEDDDFFLRVFQAGFDNVFIPEALSKWRIHSGSSAHSSSMSRSRLVYFHKLIRVLPPGASDHHGNELIGDLVAPRMLRHVGSEFAVAAKSNNRAAMQQALRDIAVIRPYLTRRRRLALECVYPVMRSQRLSRFLVQSGMRRVVRRWL